MRIHCTTPTVPCPQQTWPHSVKNHKIIFLRKCCVQRHNPVDRARKLLEMLINQHDSARGGYLLIISLDRAIRLKKKRFQGCVIRPGLYAYAGSAQGPGGIAARLKHHFSKKKKVHWHVDHLTLQASRIEAFAFLHLRECELIEGLLKAAGSSVPLPGFGSSDCKRCPAHLLALAPDFKPSSVLPIFEGRRGTGRRGLPASRHNGSGGKA